MIICSFYAIFSAYLKWNELWWCWQQEKKWKTKRNETTNDAYELSLLNFMKRLIWYSIKIYHENRIATMRDQLWIHMQTHWIRKIHFPMQFDRFNDCDISISIKSHHTWNFSVGTGMTELNSWTKWNPTDFRFSIWFEMFWLYLFFFLSLFTISMDYLRMDEL